MFTPLHMHNKAVWKFTSIGWFICFVWVTLILWKTEFVINTRSFRKTILISWKFLADHWKTFSYGKFKTLFNLFFIRYYQQMTEENRSFWLSSSYCNFALSYWNYIIALTKHFFHYINLNLFILKTVIYNYIATVHKYSYI